MIRILLYSVLLTDIWQYSVAQYTLDWGKYLNDSVSGASFINDDEAEQLAVDIKNIATHEEYVYITGRTDAKNTNEISCEQETFYYGSGDGFLAKYDKCGNLIWFRFIGTDKDSLPQSECGDFAYCLALDKNPFNERTTLYIAGYSYSNNDFFGCSDCSICDSSNSVTSFSCSFPFCSFQSKKNSDLDAFIAKYDEDGNLLKWTYFGGEGADYILDINVFNHDIFVTGATNSKHGLFHTNSALFDSSLSIGGTYSSEAFIAELDSDLCAVKFFSYMGGEGLDRGHSINVFQSTSGQVELYVSGTTSSDMGNLEYHALNSYKGGLNDAFLSLWRLNEASGIFKPKWLQYVGGKNDDRGREIAVTENDDVLITGYTMSDDFFKTTMWKYNASSAYDSTLNGSKDAFIAKFNSRGAPIWGTYFGGKSEDIPRALVHYSTIIRNVTTDYLAIAGGTKSLDLPFAFHHSPLQNKLNGDSSDQNRDAFIAILTDPPSSNIKQRLEFSSYIGGSKKEWADVIFHFGPDLALGSRNEIYMTLYTTSKDIENNVLNQGFHYNTNKGGDKDGFLAKILNSSIPNQFDCTSFNWKEDKGRTKEYGDGVIKLFPNPSTGNISLSYRSNETGIVQFIVINIRGQKVFSKNENVHESIISTFNFNFTQIASGMYFLKTYSGNEVSIVKFILQK